MTAKLRRYRGPLLGKLNHWTGEYTPDIEAHERYDAAVMRLAHPPFHQWRRSEDGSTGCDWPGCVEGTGRVVLAPQVRATVIRDYAFVIVDLFAKRDATHGVLLAGPFADEDLLRDTLPRYQAEDLRPAVLYVRPADYAVLARGGQDARTLLIELTRQPEYEDMACLATDAPEQEAQHRAA